MLHPSQIDHTNLQPVSTREDIKKLCEEALQNHFASVCVHPYYVSLAVTLLENTQVAVDTVVGFPLGMNTIATKTFETKEAIHNGASEIDMVINLGALKNADWSYIEREINAVKEAADPFIVKVIMETCYLTEEEKEQMVKICNRTGVAYIKTSTGFGSKGAQIEDIQLFKKLASPNLKIKASGGIRTLEEAEAMIAAGADRIGTSRGKQIMEEQK